MSYESYNSIISALRLMAADPSNQIALFPAGINVADEIALILADAVLLAGEEASHNIRPQMLTMTQALDDELARLSRARDRHFWSIEALQNDVRWQRFRLTARHILKKMGIPDGPASLEGLYVVQRPSTPRER